MAMKALDVEAVQAFVLVADLNSFTRAAEAMDTTQSAVSLKIKRLEDGLGRRLLERTPRMVRLSAEGSAFLGAARNLVAAHQSAIGAFAVEHRRLIVGISHHIVGTELAALLKRINGNRSGAGDRNCTSTPRARCSRPSTPARSMRRSCSGTTPSAATASVLFEEPFGWMAAPDFHRSPGEPLRLATQAEPCSVRAMAIGALDAAGIPWTEVFVGGGVADHWRRGFRGPCGGGAGAPGGAVRYHRSRAAAWSAAAAVARGDASFEACPTRGARRRAAHPRRGLRGDRACHAES